MRVPFAELPHSNESYEPRGCPLCKRTRQQGPSVAVRINPQTFHVEVAQAVTHGRLVRRDAKDASAFLRGYSGLDVVRVHRTEVGGHGRHHALYIDGARMLTDGSFRSRLHARARELKERVDLVIAPNHPGAIELVREVAGAIGRHHIVCDEDRVAALDEAERAAIIGASKILIVDDVIITGDRVRGYRQFLMELGHLSGAVHVLVAVSRPSSNAAKQSIRNLVDQMDDAESTYHAIEEVVLPDWGMDDCPWCREQEALDRWVREYPGDPPSEVIDRLTLLSDTRSGLADGVFWTWDGGQLVLGDGSIFAPADATEAELVFAVASAMQMMRSDGRLDEEFLPPVAKLLTHEFWARGRFYAPAIAAAILRMSKPHDLLPPIPSKALRRSIDDRLLEAASHGVRTEILLAVSQKKLPLTAGVISLLSQPTERAGLREFLRSELGLED